MTTPTCTAPECVKTTLVSSCLTAHRQARGYSMPRCMDTGND